MRIRAIACSLLCSFFIAACDGDPIRPEDLAGLYSLVSSGDNGRQRELLRATENCDEWLVSGRLALDPDVTYSLVLEIENDCSRAGGEVVPDERTSVGMFSLNGRTLTLTADSGTLSAEELGGSVDPEGGIEITVPDLAAAGDLRLLFMQIFAQ